MSRIGADMNKSNIDTKNIITLSPKLGEKSKQGLVLTRDLTQDFESFALMFIQKQNGQGRKGQGWQLPLSI